jgi:hypothetical protein
MKFPKLGEVYQTIFGIDPAIYGLHNSMVDTLVCMRIFLFTEYKLIIEETQFCHILEKYSQPLLQMQCSVASRTRKMLQNDVVLLSIPVA